MLLVQDQYVQNSRKNFETELQLKPNTSKQVYSDPRDIWKIESAGEEEVNSSGNESEAEDNLLYAEPSDIPDEVFHSRKPLHSRKKNVRFGGNSFSYVLDTSETSSFDNEYLGIDCGHVDTNHKMKDPYRVSHKPKWRMVDKLRSKSNPDNVSGYLEGVECEQHRVRRKEHRCGHHHGDVFDLEDVTYVKPNHKSHKYGCGDDVTRCCDYCPNGFVKMKPVNHKYVCHMMKDTEPEIKSHRKPRMDYDLPPMQYHPPPDRVYCPDEYCEHTFTCKQKKKALEAVQEQQEQFSDSTYKVPCNKFSSQTISGELSPFQGKKSLEKLTNSSQSDWLYYNGKGTVGEKLMPPRVHKMRSRRTRMNKIKNGWKKAFVQTVRDGSRNERVGVIVMGSKGPEFYSKNSEKPTGYVPFRKSKSFLDGAAKSFEVMTVDCKNVFLSSSEPGPRTNYAITDLVCPEDDDKVEDKIAKFSKNVNEIVRNSEEKFYKSLSTSEFLEKKQKEETPKVGGGEEEGGKTEEKKEEKREEGLKSKYPQFHRLPVSTLTPRTPKSFKKTEKKVSEESKAMANALNEQGKKYLENQSNSKEKGETFLEELSELKERFTPKERNLETVEANLATWGMKFNREEVTEEDDTKKEEEEEQEKEVNNTASMKSTERNSLNMQRRKKYYESTTPTGKEDEAGDATNSKPPSLAATPKTPKRPPRVKTWESPPAFQQKNSLKDGDNNLISAVFRDLVENGCAISQEESENLQSLLNGVSYHGDVCSNEVMSSSSSEAIDTSKANVSPRTPKTPLSLLEEKISKTIEKEREKEERNEKEVEMAKKKFEDFYDEVNNRKVLKMNFFDERISKKVHREGKTKKKVVLEDRIKLLREALPSLAAENEATHLKQLKKYIDRFIDRVEASTATEFCHRRESNRLKAKDASSSDSSEIRVDARKILEFVSSPFRKISSDVTINIAKKLTDALVQEKAPRLPRGPRTRKHSDPGTDDDPCAPCAPCEPSSGSERCEESEPTYLKQLKKMRNEHLNNIVLEVKRLSELLRFLDRCNRLHV